MSMTRLATFNDSSPVLVFHGHAGNADKITHIGKLSPRCRSSLSYFAAQTAVFHPAGL